MELKVIDVGKFVKYNGIRLQVVRAVDGCRGCYFKKITECPVLFIGACFKPWRKENVIFRKFDNNRIENYHGRNSKRTISNIR